MSIGAELASLRAQIAEDLAAHKGNRRSAGFRALRAHRVHNWVKQNAKRPFRRVLLRSARAYQNYATNYLGIELPVSTQIGRRVEFAHQHGIVLHGKVVIGDECIIRHNVTIGAGVDSRTAPALGKRVSVSPGAVIIGNITVGDDAQIGPNAVISTNVPEGATVFVTPPRTFPISRPKP